MAVATGTDLLTKDGILVTRTGFLKTVSMEWHVLMVIDHPQQLQVDEWADLMAAGIVSKATNVAEQKNWLQRIEAIRHSAKVPTNFLRDNVDYVMTKTRMKRGLFNIVGALSKGLFGLATEADIRTISGTLEKLESGHTTTVHNQQVLLTVMNQTRRFVSENREDIANINSNMVKLKELAVNNSKSIASVAQSVNSLEFKVWIYDTISAMEGAIKEYLVQVQLFHIQRNALHRGWLTMDIFPRAYLDEVLRNIEEKGHQTLEADWYYENTHITPVMQSDASLYFEFVVLGTSGEQYVDYNLRFYPVPLGDNYARRMIGRSRIALDSLTGAWFQPEECVGMNPGVCRVTIIKLEPGCEYSLIANTLDEKCVFEIVNATNMSSVVERPLGNSSKIVVAPANEVTYTMRCPNAQPQRRTVTHPEIIDLPAQCSMDTDTWRVKGYERGYAQMKAQFEVIIPLKPLNVSWPPSPPPRVIELLQTQHRAEVPLTALDWMPESSSERYVTWNVTRSSVTAVVSVVALTSLAVVMIRFRQNIKERFENSLVRKKRRNAARPQSEETENLGRPSLFSSQEPEN